MILFKLNLFKFNELFSCFHAQACSCPILLNLRGMSSVKKEGFLFILTEMYLLWPDMTEMDDILSSTLRLKEENRCCLKYTSQSSLSPMCLKLLNTRNTIQISLSSFIVTPQQSFVISLYC